MCLASPEHGILEKESKGIISETDSFEKATEDVSGYVTCIISGDV
jgi:hypothetical protein